MCFKLHTAQYVDVGLKYILKDLQNFVWTRNIHRYAKKVLGVNMNYWILENKGWCEHKWKAVMIVFSLYIFIILFRTTLSSSWPRPLPHPLFFQVNFKKVKVSLQLPQMLRSENQQDHQVPNFPQVRLNPPKALKSLLQVKFYKLWNNF